MAFKCQNIQENKDKKELEECLRKAGEKLTKGGDKGGRKNDKRMSKGMFVSLWLWTLDRHLNFEFGRALHTRFQDVMPSKDALRVAPTLDAMKEKYEQKPKKEKDPNAPPKMRKPREPKDPSKPKQQRSKQLSETQNGAMDAFVVRNGEDEDGSTQMTNGTDDSPKENRKRKLGKKSKEPKTKKSPKATTSKTSPKKKKPKKDWDSDEGR